MKAILCIISFLIFAWSFGQNDQLFKDGNTLYNEGSYSAAIEKYQAIVASGEHSAELYFNIANAHYKLNNVAPSIYYFEKAALLKPNDKDIKNNLVFARNMTVDAIDILPTVGISEIIRNFTNKLSFDAWAKLAVAMIIVFVLLFIAYDFAYSTKVKRLSFLTSIVSLLIGLASVAFAFHKYDIEANNQPAIVFAQETKIKSEPNLRSEEAFVLHEGTKVQVLEAVDDWKKIQLSDGKTGWIMAEDIKMLKNF